MGKLHRTYTDSACNYVVHVLNTRSKLRSERYTALNRTLIAISSMFVFLTLAFTASATDYYVATWGDNSNTGTSLGMAWAYPSYGVSQLTAGDTLYIVNGTYNEVAKMYFTNAHGGNWTHPVTVTAYNGTPIIDGGNTIDYGFYIRSSGNYAIGDISITNIAVRNFNTIFMTRYAKNITLDGLEIYGSDIVDSTSLALIAATKNITINNCSFHDPVGYNGLQVLGLRRDDSQPTHDVKITNNDFYNNHNHSMIQIDEHVYDFEISDNRFWNNKQSGGSLGLYKHDTGSWGARNFTIRDNTITDSRGIQVSDNSNGIFKNITITNCYQFGIQYKDPHPDAAVLDNVTFRNITIVNQTRYLEIKAGNDLLFDKIHLINSSCYAYDYLLRNTVNTTVRDEVECLYTPLIQYDADVTFEYTDNSVFDITYLAALGSNVTKQPAWYPNIANFTESTSGSGHRRFDIRKYNITLRPTRGHLYDVTVDAWDEASGTYRITASSTDPDNPTWINLTTKSASATYNIKRDDESYSQATTGTDGVLRYYYTGPWGGSHTFEVSESASDATPHITNLQNDAPTQQTVTLRWGCSVSNIDHYTIYKRGMPLDITESQYYLVTNLTSGAAYTFGISATTTDGITGETTTLSVKTAAAYSGRNIVRIADDVAASHGNRVAVPIRIYNATEVACAGVKLTYNASVVTVTGVTEGDFTTHLKFDDMHAADGWMVINTYIEGTQLTGDIGVADVTFVAVGKAGDTSPLDMEILSMATQNGYSVPRTVSNGLFTVVRDTSPPIVIDPYASQLIPDDTDGVPSWGEIAMLSVTVTDEGDILSVTIDLSAIGGSPVQPMTPRGDVWSVTTSASAGTPPQTYELQVCATDSHGFSNMSESVELVVMRNGDVTGDGYVSYDDVTLLENYVTYSSQYAVSSEFVADVTGDSVVDIADAMLLANYVAYPDQYTLR